MRAMILKEFRQMRRDRRTLALMLLVPAVLVTLFGYAARYDVPEIRTAVVGPAAAQVAATLDPAFDVVNLEPEATEQEARHRLRDSEADVAVIAGAESTRILVDGVQLFAAQSALRRVTNLGNVPVEILYNPDLKTSPVIVPALLGFVLLFVGMFFTSLGVVREREQGTLEQFAVTPLRPADVIIGKITPYFLVSAVNLVVVTLAGMLVFDMPFRGSLPVFVVFGLLYLFVVLGLGVLVSTASRTQAEAIQLAILVLLPQVMVSGMVFPFEAMPAAVRALGLIFPMTYHVEAMRALLVKGAPMATLWQPLVALAVMAVVVFALSVLRFRRDISPQQAPASEPAELAL
jgi:ABC-2 type transport system permease protein